MVCRNRRETTLAAIDRIKRQQGSTAVTIAVFDDASKDGTPEAIAQRYPDVRLVHGDGNAFWNGGLYQLWSAVRDAPVDAFLWLNDDTFLDPDAFVRLTAAWQETDSADARLILVGATRESDGAISYSGYDVVPTPFAFRLQRVAPDATEMTPVATFNGNVVLVGRGAVAALGLNDPGFFHNLGDVDYGLRARRMGVPVFLLPSTLGVCDSNAAKRDRGYGSPKLGVHDQWRKVNTHHGLPFRSWWRFTRRHSGKWWPLHFALPYRHLLRFWKLRSSA
ncbi:glycosyltransferase family 2 protein [Sphingomonas sp. IC-11]|uniref:glycosyltransferase family 2 protein n=1 Tax=Sphingomonas sp. IC-11 TaxID=2898528 RepID=UPI001E4A93EC|nr:glycosyltransferase family 2 protein [Sphingomonas sp. IC-11]MCD2317282.1 glycosyltransferase family 2 protein [Sphingomonas sp. IC-11]